MKRFFFNGLLIICILSVLVLPAFATITESDDIIILRQPNDTFLKESIHGYEAFLSIDALNVISYEWQVSNDNVTWSIPSYLEGFDSSKLYIRFSSISRDNYFRCKLVGINGDVVYSRVALVEQAPTNIFNFVGSCLRYVTNYISLIVNSLVTPGAPLYPLLPVLAIGIAVAFILIVIRIIKSFSWGM